MTIVTENQPLGTPTWVDLGIPDLDRAMDFYGSLFGWEFDVGAESSGRYTMCLLRGLPVAGLAPAADGKDFWWSVYLATDDCDETAKLVERAGGKLITAPYEVGDQGRAAVARDPIGAQFSLWQGRSHIGCRVVNEPNSLVRNDLVAADAEAARDFYSKVFGFTLDRNEDLPDFDFTFLRRPDGHEVAGIFGLPDATSSWATTFEVSDTDTIIEQATAAGGTCGPPDDMQYGRIATITDPFGAEFSVIARSAEYSD